MPAFADRGAPHPNPLRASFARLDPAKSGAREHTVIGATIFSSTQHRQFDHVIAMANAALEHGVFEFEPESARRADAADGRESAAEHRAAIREWLAPKTAPDQPLDRQHMVERALLVQ